MTSFVDRAYPVACVAMYVVVILGALLIIGPQYHPTDDDTIVTNEYSAINGHFEIDFRSGDIDGYSKILRNQSGLMSSNWYVTTDDRYVNQVYQFMEPYLNEQTEALKAEYILDFVQDNIAYEFDMIAYGEEDYIQYPAETLFLKTGDCEDVAFLLYTLYTIAGLDAVLIECENHMTVGVHADGLEGDYVTELFSDRRYYIAEAVSADNIGHPAIAEVKFAYKPITSILGTFSLIAGAFCICIMFTSQIESYRRSRKTTVVIGDNPAEVCE